MNKTILCAVDITQPEHEAHTLKCASQMAEFHQAQLDVITVVPDVGSSIVGIYFQDHSINTAKDKAAELLDTFVQDTLGKEKNLVVRHLVAVGKVYQEVLKTAGIDGADLIVIGAHQPHLSDYLLGENAARIVRHSPCSVYVVR